MEISGYDRVEWEPTEAQIFPLNGYPLEQPEEEPIIVSTLFRSAWARRERWDWATLEQYGGGANYLFTGEVMRVYAQPEQNINVHPTRERDIGAGDVISQLVLFLRDPCNLALNDIFGYVTIVAVSKVGAWMARVDCTSTSFRLAAENPSSFQNRIVRPILYGGSITNPFGLARLKDDEDEKHMKLFSEDTDPQIFLIVPPSRARGLEGTDKYLYQNDMIRYEIHMLYPMVQIKTIIYPTQGHNSGKSLIFSSSLFFLSSTIS